MSGVNQPLRKELGKIESITFGHGGYEDACLGVNVMLSGEGWGCVEAGMTAWDANMIKHSEHCKWTEVDRDKQYAEIMRYVSDLLSQAKVSSIDKLKNKPVEVLLDGQMLKTWRILTEVL